MRPAKALLEILAKAYPCPAFSGACGAMRWDPGNGHIPRGFLGATGAFSEVELVLVFAEPGDPRPGDHESLEEALAHAYTSFRSGNGVFHQKARAFFDLCWPDLPFEAQLRHVWVTESVLCSAERSTGPVPGVVENECGQRYLKQQLTLFPNALIVALGGKAQSRLARIGIEGFEKAHAFGLPGCNQREALPSWIRIAEILKQRQTGQSGLQNHPRNLRIMLPHAPPLNTRPAALRLDMPASYEGNALRGGKKVDGVNHIVGTMLQRGAKLRDINQRLIDSGKSEKAARMHLLFLQKNGVRILVNGEEYQKGQQITPDDFLTVEP